MAVKGSCLCGAVTYEVAGASQFMGNCHCSMCRTDSLPQHAEWPRGLAP